MEVLHIGCDGLKVAFQGMLSKSVLQAFARGKKRAEKAGEKSYEVIGGKPGHVFPNGSKGGYRYIYDQGALRAKWEIKENRDPNNWNLMARVPAQALAENGIQACIDDLWGDLKAWGAVVLSNSVNRFDVCADIVAPGFKLEAERVLCHSHSKVSRNGELKDLGDIQIVGGGRGRIDTITVGKLPGRQMQIYDKRREVMYSQKSFWFNVWGVAKKACPTVWRVEVRFGKNYLKDWNISTLDDLENKIGDVVDKAFDDIRYLETINETNISRSKVHEFWAFAKRQIVGFLSSNRCGAQKGRVREIIRDDHKRLLGRQVVGLSAALGAMLSTESHVFNYETRQGGAVSFAERIGGYVSRLLLAEADRDPDKFFKKVKNTFKRYHFLNERSAVNG